MINWPLLFVILTCLAGVISTAVFVLLLRHWRNRNARLLIFFIGTVQIWALAYLMELLLPGMFMKMICIKIQYLSSNWMAILFLGFSLSISRMPFQFNLKWYAVFSIFPIVLFFVLQTNDHHHLMWSGVWPTEMSGFQMLDFDRGHGFWVFFSVSHTIFFSGILVMVYRLIYSDGLLRKQLICILLGLLPPLAASLMFLVEPNVYRLGDLTPNLFSISGIAFLWALTKYQMLNLMPAFREAIVSSMTDPVIVLDQQDRILDANPAAQAAFHFGEMIPGETTLKTALPGLHRKVEQCRDSQTKNMEFSLDSVFGRKYWSQTFSELRTDHRKTRIGWLIVLKDITERKKAQMAVRKSGRIHRRMLEVSPNPMAFYTSKAEVTYVNPAFTKLFGWHLHELVGKRMDIVAESSREQVNRVVNKILLHPEGSHSFETQLRTKSGMILDISVNIGIYPEFEDSPDSVVVNFTDITHIKRTERDLRNTKDFVRSIINSMPSMLIGVDRKGRITHWNLEAERNTDIDVQSAQGQYLGETLPELSAHMQLVERAISSRNVESKQKVSLQIGSKNLLADIIVYPILQGDDPGAVIRVDDVSERVRIEEIMVQSEKMLSVGGLAAGMAHEINNPLAGILQNTQVIRDRLSKKLPVNQRTAEACGIDLEKLQDYMEQRDIFFMMDLVKTSGRQAARIVNNMLSFSRKSNRRKSTHNLCEILDITLDIIASDYDMRKNYDFKTIDIDRRYEADTIPVPCEKSEIQQVFLNILKNGAEAMAETPGCTPKFILRCYHQDHEGVVEIEDNGPGIAPDICKRVFEPFFTTKEIGQGTGLGLSVSYFIVTENHKGSLRVESIEGQGSKFILRLPKNADMSG